MLSLPDTERSAITAVMPRTQQLEVFIADKLSVVDAPVKSTAIAPVALPDMSQKMSPRLPEPRVSGSSLPAKCSSTSMSTPSRIHPRLGILVTAANAVMRVVTIIVCGSVLEIMKMVETIDPVTLGCAVLLGVLTLACPAGKAQQRPASRPAAAAVAGSHDRLLNATTMPEPYAFGLDRSLGSGLLPPSSALSRLSLGTATYPPRLRADKDFAARLELQLHPHTDKVADMLEDALHLPQISGHLATFDDSRRRLKRAAAARELSTMQIDTFEDFRRLLEHGDLHLDALIKKKKQ